MRSLTLVCVLAAVAVGCAVEGERDSGSAGAHAAKVAEAANVREPSEWTLERETSQMDGDVLSATRVFSFPDRRTTFVAHVSCRVSAKELPVWVESFVGESQSPEPQSAFATTVGIHPFQPIEQLQPKGRLKLPGKDPHSLGPYFGLDSGFNNQINLFGMILSGQVLFPMVMEVNNGMGAFELVLDASDELVQVLDACGLMSLTQGGSPSTPSLVAAAVTPAVEPTAAAPDTASSGPSFDCSKAATVVEQLICKEPDLGRLDGALASNYHAMRASDIGDGARTDLQTTQRLWMQVRNKCRDAACIETAYRTRLDEVCDYPVLTGVHPQCVYGADVH